MSLKFEPLLLLPLLLICQLIKGHTWPRCLDWRFEEKTAYKDPAVRLWYNNKDDHIRNVPETKDGYCRENIIETQGHACVDVEHPEERVKVEIGQILCMTWLARNHYSDVGFHQSGPKAGKRRTLSLNGTVNDEIIYASSIDISMEPLHRYPNYNMTNNRIATLNYRDCPIDNIPGQSAFISGILDPAMIPAKPSSFDIAQYDGPPVGGYNMKCGGCFTIPNQLPDKTIVSAGNYYALQWNNSNSQYCLRLDIESNTCSSSSRCGKTLEHELRAPLPEVFDCANRRIALSGDTFENISLSTAQEIKEVNPHLNETELIAGDYVNIPPCPSFWDLDLLIIPSPVLTNLCPNTRRYPLGVFFMGPYLRRYVKSTKLFSASDCENLCNNVVGCSKWSFDSVPAASNRTFSCFLKPIGAADNAVASSPNVISGCLQSTTQAPVAMNQNVGEGQYCNAFDNIFCIPGLTCVEPGTAITGYVGICGILTAPTPAPAPLSAVDLSNPFKGTSLRIIIAVLFVCLCCIAFWACRMYRSERNFLQKVLQTLPDETILPSRK